MNPPSDKPDLGALSDTAATLPEESESTEESKGKKTMDHINIQAVCQNGTMTQFKMRPTTPMQKMFDAFCSRNNTNISSVRFLYEGRRIQGSSTPKSLGLDDMEMIDVVLSQTGGTSLWS